MLGVTAKTIRRWSLNGTHDLGAVRLAPTTLRLNKAKVEAIARGE